MEVAQQESDHKKEGRGVCIGDANGKKQGRKEGAQEPPKKQLRVKEEMWVGPVTKAKSGKSWKEKKNGQNGKL